MRQRKIRWGAVWAMLLALLGVTAALLGFSMVLVFSLGVTAVVTAILSTRDE
jgi:hypothetical protein